ncbi:MAG: DUF262 domain-containing protein [Bacteroidales bacterium]|nr:DUF262 domain-containing protein [Bacteroidales bacterium]
MGTPNFQPKEVAEFLATDAKEQFVFEIPSFQRGYRWTSKQVKDLLKDLMHFSTADSTDSNSVYYLQPLVIRGEDFRWQVLDGQQRLTTLKLILNAIKPYGRSSVNKKIEYDIRYLIRPNFDFYNASTTDNLDSYYIAKAQETIKLWLDSQKDDDLAEFADVMFGLSKTKKVKFIWYEVEGDDCSDSGAIAIFNRLNRGKLKLTPSELIKALLIISADSTERIGDSQTVLSMQWNEIERRFMHDDFFSFINAGNKQFDTRTDLLFNHIVLSMGVSARDEDFAYRWFQDKYDNNESILDIWEKDVKDTFDLLNQWYSNAEIYNYIGFLSTCNVTIGTIRDTLASAKRERKDKGGEWRKSDNIKILKNLIKQQFSPVFINGVEVTFPAAIDELDYNYHSSDIRRILLLFNVAAYSKQALRFPFDKYSDESWDIEHIDSRTENELKKNEDQMKWLVYTREIINELPGDATVRNQLAQAIDECLADGIESQQWFSSYKDIYNRIMSTFRNPDPVVDKDSLGNLTLLDASTNRGYGNALFPYKRKCVVKRDDKGDFVPKCTLNTFLKYYSGTGDTSGLSSIYWSEADASSLLNAVHQHVDTFFD